LKAQNLQLRRKRSHPTFPNREFEDKASLLVTASLMHGAPVGCRVVTNTTADGQVYKQVTAGEWFVVFPGSTHKRQWGRKRVLRPSMFTIGKHSHSWLPVELFDMVNQYSMRGELLR
jgi:hypothetical protein